jgi:hypothetical protein
MTLGSMLPFSINVSRRVHILFGQLPAAAPCFFQVRAVVKGTRAVFLSHNQPARRLGDAFVTEDVGSGQWLAAFLVPFVHADDAAAFRRSACRRVWSWWAVLWCRGVDFRDICVVSKLYEIRLGDSDGDVSVQAWLVCTVLISKNDP